MQATVDINDALIDSKELLLLFCGQTVAPNGVDGQSFTSFITMLDDYNEGRISSVHCN